MDADTLGCDVVVMMPQTVERIRRGLNINAESAAQAVVTITQTFEKVMSTAG